MPGRPLGLLVDNCGGIQVESGCWTLAQLGRPGHTSLHPVIIPGNAAVISGELEDALGDGWRVLTGPQEASDIAPFFRDVWASVASAS